MYYNNFKSIIPLAAHNKKSILFVVDKLDWAYYFIAITLNENLKNDYDCFVVCEQDYLIKKAKSTSFIFRTLFNLRQSILLLKSRLLQQDKSLYFLDKKKYYKIRKSKDFTINLNSFEKNFDKKHFDFKIEMAYYFQFTSHLPFTANKNLIGIYTDGYPHEGPTEDFKNNIQYRELSRKDFFEKYLKKYDGIIVGCDNLKKAYLTFTDKIQFVYGIYKQEEFGKKKKPHKTFTIGWTGNPNREMKGFNEVIIPAIEEVKKTGREVYLKTKFTGTYDELFDFYEDIDLVLIASRADSGPSLFAEASLSNVPCISTPVGLPQMIIQHDKNGKIINRDINEFVSAIIELYDNRSLLNKFTQNIKYDYLKIMDNKVTAEGFKNFIKKL